MKLRELLFLHHADRQAIFSVLTIIVIVAALAFFVGRRGMLSSSTAAADSLGAVASLKGSVRSPKYYAQPVKKPERFPFDPNTADSTQLLRLGLQPWQVRNIYKYRASGGIYRTKSDFARLYGLTVKQYRELEPFIVISPDYQPASKLLADRPAYERPAATARGDNSAGGDSQRAATEGGGNASTGKQAAPSENDSWKYHRQQKIAAGEHVDLNAADTAVYKTVPGIGSYYARKIAAYGRQLGGYVSVDQLDEIDNFPPEAKSYFALLTDSVRKLNVNELTLYELRRHPYINYYQAKVIVERRRAEGPLKSLDELSGLQDFPPEAIARLKPYVCF